MESHLKSIYGFNNFRIYQKEIISDILKKKDVFTILPTGGGKSLLYQFPATYTKKITVVISPLISLMNDQCIYLNSKNIKTICLNSETGILDANEYKNYKIIYTTPEFIISRIQIFESITSNIGLFAIDEAHCVSQWSHDFRISYLKLDIIKKVFNKIPLLAVTATATPYVINDISKLLNIDTAIKYLLGTRRTNLEIHVKSKSEFDKCVFNEPTIIYVQTRKICESLYKKLSSKAIKCSYYHGGLSKTEKTNNHNLFINNKIVVIIATISFGMGIDKSDIRHVINYGVPNDIETYYQEIGRAGRDGLPSKATLFYNSSDFATAMFLISKTVCPKQLKLKTNSLSILQKFLGERVLCRQKLIDYYFETGDFLTELKKSNINNCNMCDNCLKQKDDDDLIDITKDSLEILEIIKTNYKKTGFNVGIIKLVNIIRQNGLNTQTKEYIKEILEILINKDILKKQYKKFGFVISVNKINIKTLIPIKVHINTKPMTLNNKSIVDKLLIIRNSIALKYVIIPSVFMNEQTILNISITNLKNELDLLKIDGISEEFVLKYGKEFITEYKSIFCEKKKTKLKTKDLVLKYFKEEKSIKEISKILDKTPQTIENHIINILETSNLDIDLDYFGLTVVYENEIKDAIKKIGSKYLKSIKDIINPKISYFWIKLCLLIIKIENN